MSRPLTFEAKNYVYRTFVMHIVIHSAHLTHNSAFRLGMILNKKRRPDKSISHLAAGNRITLPPAFRSSR